MRDEGAPMWLMWLAVFIATACYSSAPIHPATPAKCAAELQFVDRPIHLRESCLVRPPIDEPAMTGDPAIDRARRDDDRREVRRWMLSSWAACQVPR